MIAGAVERSVPWGRGGPGQSPSEIAISFIEVRGSIVAVTTKRQNLFLSKENFENDHSKLRILVDSRLENQRIWRFVLTSTINVTVVSL